MVPHRGVYRIPLLHRHRLAAQAVDLPHHPAPDLVALIHDHRAEAPHLPHRSVYFGVIAEAGHPLGAPPGLLQPVLGIINIAPFHPARGAGHHVPIGVIPQGRPIPYGHQPPGAAPIAPAPGPVPNLSPTAPGRASGGQG